MRSRGFGFVRFSSEQEADKAMDYMNNQEYALATFLLMTLLIMTDSTAVSSAWTGLRSGLVPAAAVAVATRGAEATIALKVEATRGAGATTALKVKPTVAVVPVVRF